MYTCISHTLYIRLMEFLLSEKGDVVSLGKDGMLCIRASMINFEDTTRGSQIPFRPFVVLCNKMSKFLCKVPIASLALAMLPWLPPYLICLGFHPLLLLRIL
jgi:hypothetical protein